MGYVGPVLVRTLRAKYPAASMIGLDMGYFANCLTNSDVLPECRLDKQIFADVRNIAQDMLEGFDAIIYLAAISNDPMGKAFEEVTLEVNYQAGVEMAKRAKAAGVGSFVFASSCSIYGYAEDGARTETSPVNPLTAYAKSKVYAEKGLQQLADNSYTVTSLRFATACGMSERLRLDLVVNDFVAAAVTTGKITILSDGTPWRPLIHVKDMARAIDWAMGRSQDDGGVFLALNIGSNAWNYQVKHLAETVAKVIPGVEIEINKDAQPDKRSYQVDFGLFESLAPEYQPRETLESTVAELKQGLEAMGFDNSNFRDSLFMRLKVLEHLQAKQLLNKRLSWEFKNHHG